MKKPVILVVSIVAATALALVVALGGLLPDGPGQPVQAQEPSLTIPLSFVRVGNEEDTRNTWTEANVKQLLKGVNDIWNCDSGSENTPAPACKGGAADPNITFTWPQNPEGPDNATFHDIDDPQKDVGNDGDVKDPRSNPPRPGEDEKSPEEAAVVCNNARAASKSKQFPVALIQHFITNDGQVKAGTLGVTYPALTGLDPDQFPQDINKGRCTLLSIQAKDWGGKIGEVLAHELGHVLCLGHTPDESQFEDNLMHPTADTNNELTQKQVEIARKCADLLLQNLQTPAPTAIPSPTPTPTPTSIGGVGFFPDVADSSGGSAAVMAALIATATAGVIALGGAAWYARRRWMS